MISDEYVAGFFDGEGSVTLKKEPNGLYSTIHIQIGQKTDLTLRKIMQKYGGTLSKLQGNASRSERSAGYLWGLYGQNAYRFLNAIAPYVIEKRMQVDLVIRYWETKADNIDETEFQYRREVASQLSQLKHGA